MICTKDGPPAESAESSVYLRTSPSSTHTTTRSEHSSNTTASASTTATQSSLAKIIDIQKRPRLARDNCGSRPTVGEFDSELDCFKQSQWIGQLDHDLHSRGVSGRIGAPASGSNQQLIAGASEQVNSGAPVPGPSGWSAGGAVRLTSSPNQRQQSGETLSSFESDYDLLVYLGETETEDIVDTERSLDYQDQTWRQSICGGASLAPTIDESLSELLSSGGGHNSNNNSNLQSDFDLLNTPTITGSPFSTRSGSPAVRSPSDYHQQPVASGLSAPVRSPPSGNPLEPVVRNNSINNKQAVRATSGSLEQGKRFNNRPLGAALNNDECDEEVSLVFNRTNKHQLSPVSTQTQTSSRVVGAQSGGSRIPALVKRNEPQQKRPSDNEHPLNSDRATGPSWLQSGQEQQKFGNIGTKLASLFNRKPLGGVNQVQEERPFGSQVADSFQAKSRTLGAPSRLNDFDSNQFDNLFSDQHLRHSPPILDRYSNLKLGQRSEMIGSNRKQTGELRGGGGGGVSNVDELDRLLAEMSQSLDLDSLARFDTQRTYHHRYPPGGQAATSQTLHKFQSPASLSASASAKQEPRLQHRSSQSLAERHNRDRPEPTTATTGMRPAPLISAAHPSGRSISGTISHQSNPQASCESILQDYDGASRMLEQMISEHLSDQSGSLSSGSALERLDRSGAPKGVHERDEQLRWTEGFGQHSATDGYGTPGSVQAGSTTDRQMSSGRSGHAVEPAKRLQSTTITTMANPTKHADSIGSVIEDSRMASDKSRARHNGSPDTSTTGASSQTRKLSTCSSSATTEKSVVLASKYNELPVDKRDLLGNRSVWRHSRQPSKGGGGGGGRGQQVVGDGNELEQTEAHRKASLPAGQTSSLDNSDSNRLQDNSTRESPLSRLTDGLSLNSDASGKQENKEALQRQRSPSNQTISSRLDELPPPPPAVDYNQADDRVISVKAAELPSLQSDEEELRPERAGGQQGFSQMDRMKRRTLSSMRSMRNKLTDFMSGTSSSAVSADLQSGRKLSGGERTTKGATMKGRAPSQPQRSQEPAIIPQTGNRKKAAAPPIPPKRSSSIGSEGSRKASLVRSTAIGLEQHSEQVEPPQVKPRQKRESRSATRRGQPSSESPPIKQKPVQAQQSFGHQIRERLSRSKSRISRFFGPLHAKRAQSTPNTKHQSGEQAVQDDDDDLVQPGDIARNCEPVQDRSSFDASLDRHLAASLSPPARLHKTGSSSDSGSQISGLDTMTRSSRAKKRKSKNGTSKPTASTSKDRFANKNDEKRSASLLSIKRLSLMRQKEPQTDDLDAMKVVLTNNSESQKTASKRKRKGRRSKKRQTGESGSTSSQRSSIIAKVATTSDYFGQVAPAKVADSDSSSSDKDSTGNVSPRPEIAFDSREKANDKNQASKDEAPKTSTLPRKLRDKHLVSNRMHADRPNRSQSLKSIRRTGVDQTSPKSSLKSDNSAKLDNQRTVSFSNLSRQRLLQPTNSFRPASACAQLEQVADLQKDSGESTSAGLVKPVAPTWSVELAPATTKPAQLGQPKPNPDLEAKLKPARSVSPIRAKSAAMLEDFRTKCNQLFSSSSTAQRQEPVAAAASIKGSNRSPTPVRPPRRYNFRRRSKSTTSGPGIDENKSDVIKVDAASPESTLEREESVRRPLGRKLTTLAQQLKVSATDFFHPSSNNEQARKSRAKRRQDLQSKPDTGNEDPLCLWQPVIQSSQRPSSVKRSLVGSIKGEEGGDDGRDGLDGHNQDDEQQQVGFGVGVGGEQVVADSMKAKLSRRHLQQQRSLDTDSTWESSGDENDNEGAGDNKKDLDEDKGNPNEIEIVQANEGERRTRSAESLESADGLTQLANINKRLPIAREMVDSKQTAPNDEKLLVLASSAKSALSDRVGGAFDGPNQVGGVCEQSAQQLAGERANREKPRAQQAIEACKQPDSRLQLTSRAWQPPSEQDQALMGLQSANAELMAPGGEQTRQMEPDKFQQQQHQQQQRELKQQQVGTDKILPNRAVGVYSKKEPTKLQESSQHRSTRVDVEGTEEFEKNLHSEQRICKTPFKFNANLPSPSQLLSGLSEDSESFPAQVTVQTAPIDSSGKLIASGDKKFDGSVCKDNGESGLLQGEAADLPAERDRNADERPDSTMARVAMRPFDRSHLDEADAKFLQVISHAKSPGKSALIERSEPVKQASSDDKFDGAKEGFTSDEIERQNRLSIYENVDPAISCLEPPVATKELPVASKPIAPSRPRQWRRVQTPEKPAHLKLEPTEAPFQVDQFRSRPARRGPKSSPPSTPPNWSVDDSPTELAPPVQKLVQNLMSKTNLLEKEQEKAADETADQQDDVAPAKPKRRLIAMTSIIQEPEDELMRGAASSSISPIDEQAELCRPGEQGAKAPGDPSETKPSAPMERRDSTFSSSALDGNNQDDNSDTDSSFAAAEESRRRLLNKFETQRVTTGARDNNEPTSSGYRPTAKTISETTPVRGIKFPAFAEGKSSQQVAPSSSKAAAGGSLVKRLAKNFDQTIQEQSVLAADAGKRPNKLLGQQQSVERSARSSVDEEPVSESTWYDAKSNEMLLDEAEVADFLRNFDQNASHAELRASSCNPSKGDTPARRAKEEEARRLSCAIEPLSESLAGSVSTGADPFVTLADSTNSRSLVVDANGTADGEDDATLDGDGTLNDEQLVSDEGDDCEDLDLDLAPGEATSSARIDEGSGEKGNDDNNNRNQSASLNDGADDGDARCVSSSPLLAQSTTAIDPGKAVQSASRINEIEKTEQKQAPLKARRPNDDNSIDTLNANNTGIARSRDAADHCDDGDVVVVDDFNRDPKLSSNSAAAPPEIPAPTSPPLETQNSNRTTLTTPTKLTTITGCVQPIDTNFKNSLNHIIARRSSQQSGGQLVHSASLPLVPNQQAANQLRDPAEGSRRRRREMRTTTDSGKRADKASRRKELKGLSRYYYAILGHGRRRQKKKKATGEPEEEKVSDQPKSKPNLKRRPVDHDDYLHSSTSSSSSSASSSRVSSTCSSAANSDDELEVDDKNLVRAAKKCSRLYEELEKILAHRAAKEKLRNQAAKLDTANADDTVRDGVTAVKTIADGHQLDLAPTTNNLIGRRAPGRQLEVEFEDDFTRGDFFDDYEESLSTMTERDDQISLSSSSVSSESIPEMRQRQNLQKLYHVVNEIYSSEAKFVDTLKLLNFDFRRHMSTETGSGSGSASAQNNGNGGSASKWDDFVNTMLKHLPQLQALNENLLDELKLARDQWPRTQKIAHVLVKIGPFLKHYSTYIREFESVQQQFAETIKRYPQFAERVKEFEANERCQKLTIQHHLLKPIQRIPQYRLLLQQYLHHLKPDDVDYEDTVNALEVVSRVAEHANQSMNEGANFAKLLALQAKIVCKQRDIVQPGRLFVKEGELMKVCRKQAQPRWFVLLNDALLYLTQIQSSDILYLNNELPLDDCQVSTPNEQAEDLLIGQQSEREFSVSTRSRSFALIAKSRAERDDWVSSLRQTIDEYMTRRRSFSVRQLKSAASIGDQLAQSLGLAAELQQQQQVSLLGQKAPIWTPDSRVTTCQLCTSSFSALFRRHHCRACGRVVCSACSSNKAPLMYRKCRAARVCDQCFEQLKASIHLYYLPTQTVKGLAGTTEQFGEQELRRLDEHFYTLLKSQFARHVFRLLR